MIKTFIFFAILLSGCTIKASTDNIFLLDSQLVQNDGYELVFTLENLTSKTLVFNEDFLSRFNITLTIVKDSYISTPLRELLPLEINRVRLD